MNNVTLLAIDLAKNVFQLHGINIKKEVVLKQKISRNKLLEFIANMNQCDIYMEACGSANFWGRKFKKFGHNVKMIHPKYVKPFVKRNKNDVNDAAAIASAALAPGMRFIDTKTTGQQDIQSIHRIRERFIRERTGLSNQIRGLLMEYGIVIPQGISNARKKLPEIIETENCELSELIRNCLCDLYDELKSLDKKIEVYNEKIEALFASNDSCKRLITIPGVGKLGATILASALGNGSAFKNGRHFAAFLGLVPKQHSSGGKECLLGISKGGDTYIRKTLVHGARAVLQQVNNKTDSRSLWLKNLKIRKGHNKTTVALANKIARTAWALVHEDCNYEPNYKSKLFLAA